MDERNQRFLDEIRELTEVVYRAAKSMKENLAAETDPVHDVQDLFRAFHSLKGLAGMGGYANLSSFAHDVEDILDRVRHGHLHAGMDLSDCMILATELIDRFREQVADSGNDEISTDMIDRFRHRLLALGAAKLAAAGQTGTIPPMLSGVLNDMEEHRFLVNQENGHMIYLVDAVFSFDTFDQALRAAQDAINANGEWIATLPGTDVANEKEISFRLLFAHHGVPDEVQSLFPVESSVKQLVNPSPPPPTVQASVQPPTEPTARKPLSPGADSVRVRLDELDSLLRRLEDLMLIRNRLQSEMELRPDSASRLRDGNRQFQLELAKDAIIQLQKAIIHLRMVPLDSIFRQLETAVMRASESVKKQVTLKLTGGETRIDKAVTDQLLDPLIHILRNAVDHGIEAPEIRTGRGKMPGGNLHVHAAQEGNAVILDIHDDGKGIDRDAVLERARQTGILTSDDLPEDTDVLQLIFRPGFSTAATVSDLSGRGVGLDAVYHEIQRLGGSIQVHSEAGTGTVFRLQIPVTRAILQVCFVRSGHAVVGIPLSCIVRALSFDPRKIKMDGETTCYAVDGDLHRMFMIGDSSARADGIPVFQSLILLRHMDRICCFPVNDILGEEEVTLTPFRGKTAQIPLFSATCNYTATELGYILDVPELIRQLEAIHV